MKSTYYCFSTFPNSSFDLFIKHRIPHTSAADLVTINSYGHLPADLKSSNTNGHAVINRYVSGRTMRWLKKNRQFLKSIVYVLDDNLAAMVTDRHLPPRLKMRPLQTLFHLKRFLPLVDQVYVSNSAIAEALNFQKTITIPPLTCLDSISKHEKDCRHIAYVGKAHTPEHKFLVPIIDLLLSQNEGLRFTVVGNPNAWKSLQSHPRVRSYGEQDLLEFDNFIQSCDAGILLVPLIDTYLNRSRSSSKRVTAAQLGAAPVFSDMPCYRDKRTADHDLLLEPTHAVWVEAIQGLISNPSEVQRLARLSSQLVAEDFKNRTPLVSEVELNESTLQFSVPEELNK